MQTRNKLSLALALAASIAPLGAFATNGILPYGNGMSAHGVGGAGIANPADSMSGVDNPALLGKTKDQASVGVSLFNPNRSADVGGGYVDSDSDLFFIPQAAWVGNSTPINWGVLAYALGGMNTDYPGSMFGAPGNIGVDLSGLIVAPTASYEISPAFSVGASLLLGYARFETEGPGAPLPSNLSDSATGWGVKVGANFDISKDISIGAMVQPKMNMSKMDNFCSTIFFGTDCEVTLPTMYGIGGRFGFGSTVLVADIVQANWSDVEVFNSASPFSPGWEDQTIFKIGMEFHSGSDMIYRVGYNHGDSPIPNDKVGNNVFFPAVTEDHLTVGFTKKFGGMDLIGYYAYVPENEQTQAGAPAPKIKMDQNALGIGANWKF